MSSFRRSSRDVSVSALEALPVWKQNLWRAICSLGLRDGVFPSSHVDDDGLLILEKSGEYAELFDWLVSDGSFSAPWPQHQLTLVQKVYHDSSLLPIMAPRFRVRCHEAVDIKECELYFALDKGRMNVLLKSSPPPRLPTTIFERNSIVDEWDLVDRTVSAASSPASHTAESLTGCATRSSPVASTDRAIWSSPLATPRTAGFAAPVYEVTPTTALSSHPMPGAWDDDDTPTAPKEMIPSPTMSDPGRWSPTTAYAHANHDTSSIDCRRTVNTPESAATRGAPCMAPRDYRNASFIRPGFIFPVSLNAVTYAQMTRGISEVDAHETRGPNGYEAVSGFQVTEPGGWTENGKSVYEMGGYKQKKKGLKKVKGWWGDAMGHLTESMRNWGVPAAT